MKTVFVNECAVDGCYKKNKGDGFQMCLEHQSAYDQGAKLKAFYGKTVQRKEFQNIQSANQGNKNKNCPICKAQLTPEEIRFQTCKKCNWPENELKETQEPDYFNEPPDPYDHPTSGYGNDSWIH